ncbi:hypothetical protein [Flavisphingomonas formosensis]|uniref:hypothetical protein n=1 Tax=Flavisphingomonas formosensis TaxID=861534 RepID=UPI0012FA4861|nr:hypothetical protein [Sphingomonas formosensis]
MGFERASKMLGLFDNSPDPASRAALLESFRRRNAILDTLFYDVSVITGDSADILSDHPSAEGAVLIVPPTGEGSLILCPTIEDFAANGGAGIGVMAVAGVGGSALGSAAFARNVADALGRPVAAVVSGYGLTDVAMEALGGFLWFGVFSGLRQSLEYWEKLAERHGLTDKPGEPGAIAWTRQSLDTQTVEALLKDDRFRFSLIVGHSKGNLVVSEALYAIKAEDEKRLKDLAERTLVVTMSARIAMPEPIDALDIIGQWDTFGAFNSPQLIAPDIVVPQAMHHTNRKFFGHLPVTQTLRDALAGRWDGIAAPPKRAAK